MAGMTLLIADDEPIERNSVALFIKENLSVFDRVEVAGNGFELLELAAAARPDVMLVDVEMPGMSGLDSVGLLRKKGVTGRIIIYSAFSSFGYAQEAIALGVDAYLLKPTSRAELAKALNGAAERAAEDRERAEGRSLSGQLYARVSPLLQVEFVKAITLGDVGSETMALCLSLLNLAIDNGCVVTLRLGRGDVPQNELRSALQGQDRLQLEALVGQPTNGHCAVYLHFAGRQDDGALLAQCADWASAAREKLGRLYGSAPDIGIGLPCRRPEDLTASYRKSVAELQGMIAGAGPSPDPFLHGWDRLRLLVWDDDVPGIAAYLAGAFGELSLAGVPLSECRRMARDLVVGAWQDIKTRIGAEEAVQDLIGSALDEFDRQESLLGLKGLVESCAREMAGFIKARHADSGPGYVRAALRYIERKYMGAISLDVVADSVGISPYYLSHLFREEMNITFLQYVTRYRMHQADRIARETGLPLEEVAERVGYKDASYFKRIYAQYRSGSEPR
jgi:two-component system, response regulator YesN